MLTDKAIKAAKPREKPYKIADGRGLVLVVDPRGGRYWRYRYRIAGREKWISLGTYPDVSLKRAREKLDDARRKVGDGIDPSAERRAEKIAAAASGETFQAIAEEYYAQHAKGKRLAETTQVRDRRIHREVYARLGHRTMAEIDTPEVLAALRSIEAKDGRHETAHRALGFVSRVYAYAIAVGKATRDASSGLNLALTPVSSDSHAAITDPKRFGQLLRAIDGYVGQPATVAALKLLPLVFTRPGELRLARWEEFDLDREAEDDGSNGPQWVIPAERMKMRAEHIVPLSRQAVALLRELHRITGRGELVFPSLKAQRPLSENTLNSALRGLGYAGDTHVSHGFRSSASTMMHELGWDSQLIELQLAHADRNKVRKVYNRAERLADRRLMMQA